MGVDTPRNLDIWHYPALNWYSNWNSIDNIAMASLARSQQPRLRSKQRPLCSNPPTTLTPLVPPMFFFALVVGNEMASQHILTCTAKGSTRESVMVFHLQQMPPLISSANCRAFSPAYPHGPGFPELSMSSRKRQFNQLYIHTDRPEW